MTKKIIIGSRGSKLALLYAQKAKNTILQKTDLNDEEKLAFIKRVDLRCPVSETISNGTNLDFVNL